MLRGGKKMRKIKTFKDIAKYAGAKQQILLVQIDTGEVAENPYKQLNDWQGRLKAYEELANSENWGEFVALPEVKEFLDNRIEQAKVHLDAAQSELDSIGYAEFYVRGFTPQETLECQAVINVLKPRPPIKMREVGWEDRAPLEQTGRVQPPRLRSEAYTDETDPVYLRELEAWEQELAHSDLRVIAYTLVKCVQGCDLTDDEIKAELGEDAHPAEPIEEFRLRLDQIGRILSNSIAMPIWMRIQEKIAELTGVNPERVDFTSLGLPRQSYRDGNRVK
jgi:hypothetical protein